MPESSRWGRVCATHLPFVIVIANKPKEMTQKSDDEWLSLCLAVHLESIPCHSIFFFPAGRNLMSSCHYRRRFPGRALKNGDNYVSGEPANQRKSARTRGETFAKSIRNFPTSARVNANRGRPFSGCVRDIWLRSRRSADLFRRVRSCGKDRPGKIFSLWRAEGGHRNPP